ncbi:MAG: SpoIIE family protein phosphatase [Armatimonadetes bacterium]|nr:SpoIIE family protein phosphatase [Armatimonadota bacterium]
MASPMETSAISQDQLAQLVNQAPVAMCVVAAPSLRIMVANQQFLSLAGFPSGSVALVGELPRDQPTGGLIAKLLPAWRDVVDTGAAFSKDEISIMDDGRQRLIDVTAVAVKRRDGSVWAIMTTLVDVTERRRVEAEVREERRLAEEEYGREARIAARFQSALLPRGRIILPGYAVAHTYRPALSEAAVGGDFYNFLAIDEHRIAIVIGDVGGKGLEAAVVAARVQHSLIALALNGRRDPGKVLEGARRVVTVLEEPEQLVTVFFGILDLETGHLRYASAGHDPALVWQDAAGRVKPLLSDGPAIIGIMVGSYRAHGADLSRGDVLLLYTDGLPEAHPRRCKELLGMERVVGLLAECHDQEPAMIIETMYQAAVRHSEGYLRDDIAMIVVRRLRLDEAPSETAFVGPPQMQRRLDPRAGEDQAARKRGTRRAKAQRMPDFGDDGWQGMLCVETGIARPPRTLAPGEGWVRAMDSRE